MPSLAFASALGPAYSSFFTPRRYGSLHRTSGPQLYPLRCAQNSSSSSILSSSFTSWFSLIPLSPWHFFRKWLSVSSAPESHTDTGQVSSYSFHAWRVLLNKTMFGSYSWIIQLEDLVSVILRFTCRFEIWFGHSSFNLPVASRKVERAA